MQYHLKTNNKTSNYLPHGTRTCMPQLIDVHDFGFRPNCYIATMAYGDYDHPQVIELRRFRDNFLSKTIAGRRFIKLYYRYSPSLVEMLKNKQNINLIIRNGLDQFIKSIKK